MEALFLHASRVVAPGVTEPQDPATRLEELMANLAEQPAAVRDFARTLGLRYCTTNSVEEILEDHRGLRELDAADAAASGAAASDAAARGAAAAAAQFRLRVTVFNDHLKVKILARDRIGLFASLSGILLVNGADIVRADIHTFCDTAIDEFVITAVHGYDILERRMEKELSAWIDDLRRSFEAYLAQPAELERLVTEIEINMRKSGRRVPEAFHRPTEVSVSRIGERRLRIDLTCTDRPALLHDVARLLASMGCDVRAAVIDTTGWYVMDRFEAEAREPTGPDAADRLQAAIRAAVT
jgi:UTP:GlnB (protein PII) uridylyltransferase